MEEHDRSRKREYSADVGDHAGHDLNARLDPAHSGQIAASDSRPLLDSTAWEALGAAVVTTDLNGMIKSWNSGASELFGQTFANVAGLDLRQVFDEHAGREQIDRALTMAANGEYRINSFSSLRPDGIKFSASLSVSSLLDSLDKPTGYALVAINQTEAYRQAQQLAIQYAAAQALSESLSLSEAMPRLLESVCQALHWEWGSVWLVDSEHNVLHCVAHWSAPEIDARRLIELSQSRQFPPGVGLPGSIWQQNAPIWIPNVLDDQCFTRSDGAADAGLHAAIGFPIRIVGNVLGVMEFLSRSIQAPDNDLLATMGTLGGQIGLVIERRQAEEERIRQATEYKFQRLVELAPDAIMTVDAAGRILMVNNQTEHLFGYRRDELIGKSIEVLLPERYRAIHRRHMSVYAAHPRIRPMGLGLELFGRRRDGTEFPVEISLSPVIEDDSRYTTAIIRDVRAQKQAEERLRRSEMRLAEAQQIAQLGSWEWDIKADTIHWSDQLYRVFDIEPDEFDGSFQRYLTLIHPDDRQAAQQMIEEAFQQRAPFTFEHRVLRRDGSVRLVTSRGELIMDESGEPIRMIGTGQDITDRRRAEEQAHQLVREQAARVEAEAGQARLAFLAEASAILASSVDFQDTLTGVARLAVPYIADWCAVYLATNRQVPERLSEIYENPTTLTGVRADLDQPGDDPRLLQTVADVLATGEPLFIPDVRSTLAQKGASAASSAVILDELGVKSAMVVPMISRGQSIGAITLMSTKPNRSYTDADLALGIDLGQRAAIAVDSARLFQEARDAVRLREDFLSIASHELKTPLTTIKGYVQMLRRQLDRPEIDLGRFASATDQLQQQVLRLERLTNDLLDISRIQQGRVALRLEQGDLAALTRQVVLRTRESPEATPAHRISLTAPDAMEAVFDPARIDQVLTNILSNALKYSPDGGEVTVALRQVGDWAEIKITDQGIGIPVSEQDKLFRPFVRAEGAHRFGGAGLGLYISSQIVSDHGGKIGLESSSGAGSTLTITLPLTPSQAATSLTPVSSPRVSIPAKPNRPSA